MLPPLFTNCFLLQTGHEPNAEEVEQLLEEMTPERVAELLGEEVLPIFQFHKFHPVKKCVFMLILLLGRQFCWRDSCNIYRSRMQQRWRR